MKLGIYCRISRIKDGNDLSIQDQKQKGIKKANDLSLPYELYVDEGISGASDKIEDRPEFERFISDVSTGKLSAVYAYDQSRFERNPQVRFLINDIFKKNRISYYTELDGEVDLNDPQAEFFGDLLSVINKYHVTLTKIKVKSALRSRVKSGKAHSILPYGYTKNENSSLVIDNEEAEEYELVMNWAEDLNLDKNFELIAETEYRTKRTNIDSLLHSIENDPFNIDSKDPSEEREMDKFQIGQKLIGTNMAVVMFMVSALGYFEGMPKNEIRKIAVDIALQGRLGFSPDKDGYRINSIPNKEFSGYNILAYYYVSWMLSSPELINDLQLPFDEEYQLAKQMYKPKI